MSICSSYVKLPEGNYCISLQLGCDDMETSLAHESPIQWTTLQENIQWEFQDPKMEVLYHIRQYFRGISPYIALI